MVFEKFIDGSGRMDERPVRYIYADGWLTEADFKQRTLVRRQLARAGEQYDPLKPGEGRFRFPSVSGVPMCLRGLMLRWQLRQIQRCS